MRIGSPYAAVTGPAVSAAQHDLGGGFSHITPPNDVPDPKRMREETISAPAVVHV
jgi:hypothetical protein